MRVGGLCQTTTSRCKCCSCMSLVDAETSASPTKMIEAISIIRWQLRVAHGMGVDPYRDGMRDDPLPSCTDLEEDKIELGEVRGEGHYQGLRLYNHTVSRSRM